MNAKQRRVGAAVIYARLTLAEVLSALDTRNRELSPDAEDAILARLEPGSTERFHFLMELGRRLNPTDGLALDPATVSPDTVATLLDLARAGQEADFRWLAASAGVPAEAVGALWTGTRARVAR